MKLIAACLVCVLAGVGIGWYLGYARPVARDQRKLLQEYQTVREHSNMTDAEWADLAEHYVEYLAASKRTDEFAAVFALAVSVGLERGDTNGVRKHLANTISFYYQNHRLDGDTNLLARIERVAATNATVAAAISRKAK